jgi:hypothetical protein
MVSIPLDLAVELNFGRHMLRRQLGFSNLLAQRFQFR